MAFKNKDERNAYQRWIRRYGPNSIRAWFRNYKKTLKCSKCPEKHPACLDFHHLNPADKTDTVIRLVHNGASKDRILAEMAKCVVLCANCHRKEHYMQEEMKRALDEARWSNRFGPSAKHEGSRERMTRLWREDENFRENHRQRIIAYNSRRKKSSK